MNGVTPRTLTLPVKPMIVEPVTLDGQHVRLEPLTQEHYSGLCENVMGDDIWRWIFTPVNDTADMRKFVEKALTLSTEGSILPFVTIYKPENCIVGTTRYLNIDKSHHSMEIGTTVIGKRWQRTVVNSEAKYLMLRQAFEVWGCLRVQLQTDALQSQNAILRLGATQEGVLRNHRICADGRLRDTILFGITDEDWRAVKLNLEAKLA